MGCVHSTVRSPDQTQQLPVKSHLRTTYGTQALEEKALDEQGPTPPSVHPEGDHDIVLVHCASGVSWAHSLTTELENAHGMRVWLPSRALRAEGAVFSRVSSSAMCEIRPDDRLKPIDTACMDWSGMGTEARTCKLGALLLVTAGSTWDDGTLACLRMLASKDRALVVVHVPESAPAPNPDGSDFPSDLSHYMAIAPITTYLSTYPAYGAACALAALKQQQLLVLQRWAARTNTTAGTTAPPTTALNTAASNIIPATPVDGGSGVRVGMGTATATPRASLSRQGSAYVTISVHELHTSSAPVGAVSAPTMATAQPAGLVAAGSGIPGSSGPCSIVRASAEPAAIVYTEEASAPASTALQQAQPQPLQLPGVENPWEALQRRLQRFDAPDAVEQPPAGAAAGLDPQVPAAEPEPAAAPAAAAAAAPATEAAEVEANDAGVEPAPREAAAGASEVAPDAAAEGAAAKEEVKVGPLPKATGTVVLSCHHPSWTPVIPGLAAALRPYFPAVHTLCDGQLLFEASPLLATAQSVGAAAASSAAVPAAAADTVEAAPVQPLGAAGTAAGQAVAGRSSQSGSSLQTSSNSSSSSAASAQPASGSGFAEEEEPTTPVKVSISKVDSMASPFESMFSNQASPGAIKLLADASAGTAAGPTDASAHQAGVAANTTSTTAPSTPEQQPGAAGNCSRHASRLLAFSASQPLSPPQATAGVTAAAGGSSAPGSVSKPGASSTTHLCLSTPNVACTGSAAAVQPNQALCELSQPQAQGHAHMQSHSASHTHHDLGVASPGAGGGGAPAWPTGAAAPGWAAVLAGNGAHGGPSGTINGRQHRSRHSRSTSLGTNLPPMLVLETQRSLTLNTASVFSAAAAAVAAASAAPATTRCVSPAPGTCATGAPGSSLARVTATGDVTTAGASHGLAVTASAAHTDQLSSLELHLSYQPQQPASAHALTAVQGCAHFVLFVGAGGVGLAQRQEVAAALQAGAQVHLVVEAHFTLPRPDASDWGLGQAQVGQLAAAWVQRMLYHPDMEGPFLADLCVRLVNPPRPQGALEALDSAGPEASTLAPAAAAAADAYGTLAGRAEEVTAACAGEIVCPSMVEVQAAGGGCAQTAGGEICGGL